MNFPCCDATHLQLKPHSNIKNLKLY